LLDTNIQNGELFKNILEDNETFNNEEEELENNNNDDDDDEEDEDDDDNIHIVIENINLAKPPSPIRPTTITDTIRPTRNY
jgi:hypothetical protein